MEIQDSKSQSFSENETHDFWSKKFNLSLELKKRKITVGIWIGGLEDQMEEIPQSKGKIQMAKTVKEVSNMEQRSRRLNTWIISIPEIEEGKDGERAIIRKMLEEKLLSWRRKTWVCRLKGRTDETRHTLS